MLEKAGEGIASDVAGLKAWKKDPDKYAVMELVWHGIGNLDIMKELDLTYDMLRELYPTSEELKEYSAVFRPESPSDEELEKGYQKMLRERDNQQ